MVLDGLAEAFEVGSPHGNDDETKIKEPEEEAVEAGREDREAEVMVEDAIVRSLLVVTGVGFDRLSSQDFHTTKCIISSFRRFVCKL